MVCSIKSDLTAYLDGETGAAETERIRAHLETCAECRQAAGDLRRSYAALEYVEAAPVPAGFASRVAARTTRRARRRPVWFVSSALSAAAILVLALTLYPRDASHHVIIPSGGGATATMGSLTAEEEAVVENIDVLENYDVISDMDMLGDYDTLIELDTLQEVVPI